MNRHRLDNLALLLAAQGSRRQALRVITAGFVSTVVLARSPRPAAAALCPNRIPMPGHKPTVNGCGPSGYGWVIPDSWNRANFTPACNAHDRCYGTCNKDRGACDRLMRNKMYAACDRAYDRRDGTENLWRLRCRKRADTYYKAVSNHGKSAFEDAQRDACICCLPDQTACTNTCCPTSNCFECDNGFCRNRCGTNQYCSNNVCKDWECPPEGCGG